MRIIINIVFFWLGLVLSFFILSPYVYAFSCADGYTAQEVSSRTACTNKYAANKCINGPDNICSAFTAGASCSPVITQEEGWFGNMKRELYSPRVVGNSYNGFYCQAPCKETTYECVKTPDPVWCTGPDCDWDCTCPPGYRCSSDDNDASCIPLENPSNGVQDPDEHGIDCSGGNCDFRCPSGYSYRSGGFCVTDEPVGMRPNNITQDMWFQLFGTMDGWTPEVPYNDVVDAIMASGDVSDDVLDWFGTPNDSTGIDWDSIDFIEVDFTGYDDLTPEQIDAMSSFVQDANSSSIASTTIKADAEGNTIIRDSSGNIIFAEISGTPEQTDNGDGTTTDTTTNQTVKNGVLITTITTVTKDSSGNVIDTSTQTQRKDLNPDGSGPSDSEKIAMGAGSGDAVSGDEYSVGVTNIIGAVNEIGEGWEQPGEDEGEYIFDVDQEGLEAEYNWQGEVDGFVDGQSSNPSFTGWQDYFNNSTINTTAQTCSIDGNVSVGGQTVPISLSLCEFESTFRALGVFLVVLTQLSALFIAFRGLD